MVFNSADNLNEYNNGDEALNNLLLNKYLNNKNKFTKFRHKAIDKLKLSSGDKLNFKGYYAYDKL